MDIESRLYVVLREAAGEEFANFTELAAKVHESGAAEFTYSRLDEDYMMQPSSIASYVALIHFLGLLRTTQNETYECVLSQEPTPDGARELITRKAVDPESGHQHSL